MVTINRGPASGATSIDDGIDIKLNPTSGNVEFILPDAWIVPVRIYILRNISDAYDAQIYSIYGDFFACNSNDDTLAPIIMNHVGGGGTSQTKTLIFVSDGINCTYGRLGFN